MFLAGRSDELARLTAAGRRSALGEGRVVTVSGPVATGKTALLHAFGDRVADESDATLLRATCSPGEQEIPFGVARQLLHSAPLVDAEADAVARLLEDGAYAAAFADSSHGADAGTSGAHLVRTVQDLCDVVAGLAARRPLVISVDDVQHGDPASLDLLVHLIRRTRRARVLVVLAEREHGLCGARSYPGFAAELDREPLHERIRLGLLPRPAVSVLLAERLGADTAARLAADAHAISGGNPLLVNALLEDLGTTREDRFRRTIRVSAGDAYGRALVGCLYRLNPVALHVAQGLAVLGESGTTANLAELLGLEPATTTTAAQALHNAGLVDYGRFHDPRARSAVLDTMTRAEREAAHAKAATLLHIDGEPDTLVARHLAAAGEFPAPWAVRTLRVAAEAAVCEGVPRLAVDYLKLAERIAPDECERVSVKALLVGLEWLANPAAAARHMPWLSKAVRGGRLSGRDALACVRYLAWYGRPDEAKAALEAGQRPCAEGSGEDWPAEARAAHAWLRSWYPDLVAGPMQSRTVAALPATLSRIEGVDLLTAVLGGQVDGDEAERRADRILRRATLDETTTESITSALTALVYAERTTEARDWCTSLLDRAAARHSPIAHARLAAVLAEVSLRHGDLRAAEEYGRIALTRIQPEGWGVAVGLPLAARVGSAVARGDCDAAARHLELPSPGAMFRSLAGLHYLQACGRYNMATGRFDAALHDFTTCGRLMAEWGTDLPGILPWRVEAARAHHALGDEPAARALVEEQLAMLPQGPSRARGMALATHAGTLDLRRRPPLLWQAVNELQATGDRLELSRAYHALGLAYRDLGEFGRARRAADRATHLAEVCQAPPSPGLPLRDHLAAVPDRAAAPAFVPASTSVPASAPAHDGASADAAAVGGLAPVGAVVHGSTPEAAIPYTPPVQLPRLRGGEAATEPTVHAEDAAAELSSAERRVAALAAKGYTNREISRRLFITVSTVEQHLTRVYRKLGVARRLDLPPWLEAYIAG
ncbi:helix-turn-helix transcriptional regulator [Streptodolium elevatio]|uniref:AAA family ATPase n=1 Tax=Streptodolium elevatio TaxID=3157996 RepID=A0ABV3DPF1_9ACTN